MKKRYIYTLLIDTLMKAFSPLRKTFGAAEKLSSVKIKTPREVKPSRLALKLISGVTLAAALFFTASTEAEAAFTITRTSSPIFYNDFGVAPDPVPLSMYTAYQITSTTYVEDAWVRIENFAGGVVGLATYESGVVHLGELQAGVPKMAYFYLSSNGTSGVSQTHDVKVYDRYPTAAGVLTLATSSWTLTSVADTNQNNSNKVTALVSGPSPPTLGGLVTITVSGDTGNIGNNPGPNGPLAFTPAAYGDWRADSYQLISSSITFSNGNTGTFTDQLYFASMPGGSNTHYEAIYTFRAISVTTAPTAISPVAYLPSGGMTHTFLNTAYYTLAALSPIQPASNTLTLSKSVSVSTLPSSGGTVTYTIRITNASTSVTGNLDSIKDTLPAGASYINGTSYFNGVLIANPSASGSNITWYNMFSIPANTFRDLTFQATLPGTSGTYTNSVVAYAGQATIIDTTLSTLDNVPATATTLVLYPPTISKSFAPNSIPPGGTSTITFTITNPNTTTAITGVAFTDTLPVAPAAMTLSSAATTNTCGGTLTDNSSNPLAIGSSSVKLAGGSLAAGGSCTITVIVTAATSGSYVNTTGTVSSTNAGTGLTANATLTVTTKPSISISFAPSSIASGGTSTLTYVITNNYASQINSVTFTNTFPVAPGAMTVASPLATSNTCGGTLTDNLGGALAAADAGIQLSGGSIAANSTCTITIDVTASVSGNYSNTTGGVASTETGAAGSGSNTAVLTVLTAPTIAKAFSPTTVAINEVSTLTFTITNPNTNGTLTGVGFTDTFPVNVTLSSATTTNTCGGTLTDSASNPLAIGSTSVKLTGGSIAAGSNCTITVSVKSATAGTYNNTSGSVTSTNGGTGGTASATLTVTSAPTFTKSFGTNPIMSGGTSLLTITITNNSGVAMSAMAFTDTFPTSPGAMTLSSATTSNTCGGTLADNLGGAIGIGDAGLRLTGGTLGIGATCTITATVTASIGGRYTNTTTTLTSNVSTANAATGTLNVFTITKFFVQNPILPTGTSTLQLNVNNLDAANAISNVTFADIFPTTPAQMSLSTATTTNSCGGTLTDNGGGALAVGSTSIKLTGGSIAANGGCIITATVKLNTATVGNYTNTAGANATDILKVTLSPTVTKSFATSPIATGGTSVMTLILTNNTTLGALSSVSFTDTFPSGVVVAATPSLSTTCGGTITGGAAGDGYLNLSGGAIAAGAGSTCTISVNVTSATGGTYNNTTSGVTSTQTPVAGPASNTATLLVQMPAPSGTKSFSPSSVGLNGTSQMTISFTNPNASNIIGAAFTDTYPAGLSNAASGTVVASNTCGGSVTAVNSGTSTTLVNGIIPPSGCSIVINVVGTAYGALINSTGTVTSTNAATYAGASGTLTVKYSALTVSKAFAPTSVTVGTSSTLTITLTNPNSVAITGTAFTDTYPTNVVNTATPAGATTCAGGSVTAVAATDTVALSGATVPANGSCTVTVNVKGTIAGSYVNTIPIGAVTSSNALDNTSAATATLTVTDPPSLIMLKTVSTFSDPYNALVNPKSIPGAYKDYLLTINNSGGGAAYDVVVTDPIPVETEFFAGILGGGSSVVYTDTSAPNGLTGISSIAYSNDNGTTWTYSPPATFDPAVTNIKVTLGGTLNSGKSFTLKFRVRIK